MNRALTLLAAVLSLSLAAPALAQEGKIELKSVVEKEVRVVNDAGEEVVQLVTADKVVPGDVVIYTVTYTNVADQAVDNVVITNPINDALSYVVDSAFAPGADVSFSVDGGASFDVLDALTIERDGTTIAAGVDDLTHIRWILREPLDPGAQGFARFRARLN
ncbi:MAG: hypothetical protein AAFY69_12815 [Pseudomonadota bacterium]